VVTDQELLNQLPEILTIHFEMNVAKKPTSIGVSYVQWYANLSKFLSTETNFIKSSYTNGSLYNLLRQYRVNATLDLKSAWNRAKAQIKPDAGYINPDLPTVPVAPIKPTTGGQSPIYDITGTPEQIKPAISNDLLMYGAIGIVAMIFLLKK
jgi:hypothetical protein